MPKPSPLLLWAVAYNLCWVGCVGISERPMRWGDKAGPGLVSMGCTLG